MRKNYFLPQTEIIPHITLECIQSTIFNPGDTPIIVGDDQTAP